MIKLWWLMWYFSRPARLPIGNVPPWGRDEINRDELVNYLSCQKHFCENWKATIRRQYWALGERRPRETTTHGLRWEREKRKK